MARVLIGYGVDAADAARDLADALTNRGHTVRLGSKRGPEGPLPLSADLDGFDTIVVVWSEASVRDAFLVALAHEAQRDSKLVQTRLPSFPPDRIPFGLHDIRSYAVTDVSGIADALPPPPMAPAPSAQPLPQTQAPRRVGASEQPAASSPLDWLFEIEEKARRETAASPNRSQGVGAADSAPRHRLRDFHIGGSGAQPSVPAPAAPGSPSPSASDDALKVEAGRLVHKIPNKMWLGEPETVEVRIGAAAAGDIATGLVGRGSLTAEDIPIVETMSVSLYSPGGAFEIERQSETTQLVRRDAVKHTLFGSARYASWIFLVTPRKTGSHKLFVKVSAGLKDSRGVATSASLPDREFAVTVSVNKGRALRKVVVAAAGAIALALLGAITQEIWWPKLEALLRSWGWL